MLKVSIIDHLNLDVISFDETRSFYEKVFGFRLLADQSKERNCQIIGNKHIKLCIYEVHTLELGQGLNHFGFHVENYEDIVEVCNENDIPLLLREQKKCGKNQGHFM